jgi:hypothetical protein
MNEFIVMMTISSSHIDDENLESVRDFLFGVDAWLLRMLISSLTHKSPFAPKSTIQMGKSFMRAPPPPDHGHAHHPITGTNVVKWHQTIWALQLREDG